MNWKWKNEEKSESGEGNKRNGIASYKTTKTETTKKLETKNQEPKTENRKPKTETRKNKKLKTKDKKLKERIRKRKRKQIWKYKNKSKKNSTKKIKLNLISTKDA